MDVVLLSRLQFGLTTIYHFFFVPLTIGLTLMVAIMETMYVRKKDASYLRMAKFWGKRYTSLLENIDDTRLIYPE